MTLEEMQAQAEKVVDALKAAGFEEVEYLKDDHKPGEPLPIVYMDSKGNMFSLSLSIA